MAKGTLVRFFALLWKEYNYQLLLVLATLASLIVESAMASSRSSLRLIPQFLLAACLFYFLWKTHGIFRSVHPAPQVPYSVCVGKSHDWFDNFARRQQEQRLQDLGIQWTEVQRLYRIHQSDWVFLSGGTLSTPQDWIRVTRQLLGHFWELQKRVEGVPIHHFYFVAPPSMLFAFGAYVGRRVPHLAYHHVGNVRRPYLEVTNTTARDTSGGYELLNTRIPNEQLKYISVERTDLPGKNRVIVVLDFTNHKTSEPYIRQDEARELIRVNHSRGVGHIPADEWEALAQEVASILLEVCDTGSDLDIYINTPLALSFMIGSIVGPVRGVTLCEFNVYLQEYVACLKLTDPALRSVDMKVSAGIEAERQNVPQ